MQPLVQNPSMSGQHHNQHNIQINKVPSGFDASFRDTTQANATTSPFTVPVNVSESESNDIIACQKKVYPMSNKQIATDNNHGQPSMSNLGDQNTHIHYPSLPPDLDDYVRDYPWSFMCFIFVNC